jgi:hypothetical protein
MKEQRTMNVTERRRDNLNKIRSRLGSVSKTTRINLPPSVRRLLEEDLPALIAVADTGSRLMPRQSWEQRLGETIVDGWEQFQDALDDVGAKLSPDV